MNVEEAAGLLDDLDAFEDGEQRFANLHPDPRVGKLLSALALLTKGMGTYSRDQLTHATNVINESKETARKALAEFVSGPKPTLRCDCGQVLVCFDEVRKRDEELARLKETA